MNFKDIILYHIRRFWRFLHTWEWDGRRFYHLYNPEYAYRADCYLPALGGGYGRYRFLSGTRLLRDVGCR